MTNLRIIHDNAADRAAITASTTAGTLVATNMLTDLKGQVHRSTGTSVTYTLTWPTGEAVGAVALPATNLSADATIRVRLYADTAGTAMVADSGTQYACPGLNLGLWDWAMPLNVNAAASIGWPVPLNASAFAFGGLSKTAIFFDNQLFARRCRIDLVDANNAAGYIDCARLVVGAYWSPQHNASYGVQISVMDTSAVSRSDAGDQLVDRSTQHDTLTLDLQYMPESDRAQLMQIIRGVGTARNIFLSLLPQDASSTGEQDAMIYGKRSNSAMSFDFYNAFSHKIEMEGW